MREVESGQTIAAAARTLGIGEHTLFKRVKAQRQGTLSGAVSKTVSADQMEISLLRAELARVKMERDILPPQRRRSVAGDPAWEKRRRTSRRAGDVLEMAWFRRTPNRHAELIFHSDRGSRYASCEFNQLPREHGITASMSREGIHRIRFAQHPRPIRGSRSSSWP